MSQDTQGQEEQSSMEEVPTQEQVEETPDTQPVSNEAQDNPDELPAEVKERTRRNFERMRQERDEARRLAENLQRQPQVPYQAPSLPIEVDESNFVDEDGNVDVTGLQKALRQSKEQAALAARMAQEATQQSQRSQEEIRRYEQTRQAQEAYTKYPQLDPDDPEYDETFYIAVRNHAIGEISEGKNISLIGAAERVAKYYKPVEEVKKQAVKEYQQSQQKRVQGPIESGRGESRSRVDEEDLRRGTIEGSTEALMERLKRLK